MNTNRIDKIGVAAVIDYFCRMGHIDPHINFDDKIPVWDGDIDIHKNVDSNSKDDIEFNLAVQVKSSEHKSNNFNTSINQSIDINDIELYKKKGGTLLIKVLVGKHKSQIYFAYLGKIEINKLLEQISKTQKSKDVICQKAPKDFKDLIPRLRTIHLQGVHNLISLDNLKDKTNWSFNLSCGPMSKDTSPIDWLATNTTDILVSLPGHSEQFYLDAGPSYVFTEQCINRTVSVNDKVYFPSVKLGTNQIGHYIHEGDFLYCQCNDFSKDENTKPVIDIKITPSSTYVDEYLNELHFLNAVLTNKHFFIGDTKFNLPDSSFPEEKIIGVKTDIDFFEKLIRFLELNNIDTHFDFKSLTEEDFSKLEFLVRLFNNESPKPIDGIKTPFTCFTIGKLNLCLAVNKIETGGFRLCDINRCSAYRVCEQTEERINFPIYSYLFSNGIFPDNLRYSNIVSEYQKYNIAEKNLNFVNFDILNLINEYDKSHKEIYLNSAKSLIEWLIKENKEEDFTYIYKINLLQINSRMSIELTKEDKDFLLSIQSKDNISFDFAASVLLKETARAQSYFNRMTENERNEIVQYPIYTLYENLINNNNG